MPPASVNTPKLPLPHQVSESQIRFRYRSHSQHHLPYVGMIIGIRTKIQKVALHLVRENLQNQAHWVNLHVGFARRVVPQVSTQLFRVRNAPELTMIAVESLHSLLESIRKARVRSSLVETDNDRQNWRCTLCLSDSGARKNLSLFSAPASTSHSIVRDIFKPRYAQPAPRTASSNRLLENKSDTHA